MIFYLFVLFVGFKLILLFKMGIGDWGLGPIPNPQSPIPNPQSPKIFKNIKNIKFLLD